MGVAGGVGFLIFVVSYIVHGFMLLPFDLVAAARDAVAPLKCQPGVYMATKKPWALASSLIINVGVAGAFLSVMTAQSVWTRGAQGYRLDSTFPSKHDQLVCFLVGLAWNEINFYYSHRLLHSKSLYGSFHKKHHEF